MPIRAEAAVLALVIGLGPAGAEAPLSAIDWLSQSVDAPAPAQNGSSPGPTGPLNEAPVTKDGALPGTVAVSVIGGPTIDGAGLLSPSATGFPHALWGLALTDEATLALRETGGGGLPALRALMLTLLLAEAEPPADSRGDGALLMARIDKLLELGALDQAEALMAAAGPAQTAEVFRRAFDIALLTGTEDQACAHLQQAPELAPTLTARVFCLARDGDWSAAALTLRTAQALGRVSADDYALLSRFLDADLAEQDSLTLPPPPNPMTPLIWRIYDAIGEPLPTTTLPVAFAHAEMSANAGWKAQLEAAERLAREGAIPPNLLLGLYTEREPAASGGVWDRVDAFQSFDSALEKADARAVEQRLPLAYARMADVEAEVPFAELFAERLARLPLTGDAARIAWEMGLLSSGYRTLAGSALKPADARAAFLAGLAAGDVTGLTAPSSLGRAIAPAFAPGTPAPLPDGAEALLDQRRTGEAILLAIRSIDQGLTGQSDQIARGLALLRRLGLEDTARRTALEAMLLERRG